MRQEAFLNISFEPQLKFGQLTDIRMGSTFLKSSERVGGLGLSSRPCSMQQPAPITQ